MRLRCSPILGTWFTFVWLAALRGANCASIYIVFCAAFCASPATAQLAETPEIVIQAGGPYVSHSNAIQTFNDSLSVPGDLAGKPLTLIATNGSLTAPGFSWVRMFLSSGESDGQPTGQLLVDEHTFTSSAQVYLNISGQVPPGSSRIVIQAAGSPGSTFSWKLRAVAPPRLSTINSSLTFPGARLIIHGAGFSPDPEGNRVAVGNQLAQIVGISDTALKIVVPPNLNPSTYPVFAMVGRYRSNAIKIVVRGVPAVTGTDTNVVQAGSTLMIRGSNFGFNPADVQVFIGNARASVVGVRDDAITVLVPAGTGKGYQHVIVAIEEARASGNSVVFVR